MTTHTIDTLMELADNYEHHGITSELGKQFRKDLRAALTEALGPETWTDDGGWTFEIEKPMQPVVKESLSTQSVQPVREPLTDEQIGMAFRKVFPVGGVVFTNGATEFARSIERSHGIG